MLGSGGKMKHHWESDNEIQDDGKVLATCKLCKVQGEVIWREVYPTRNSGEDHNYPYSDNCSGK